MNINKLIQRVYSRSNRYVNQRRGWTTNRKIVVIESDDWGSIRMPSRKVYEKTLAEGLRVDKCTYSNFDTLADKDDFNALFEVLLKHKDCKGNHPTITANTIVANPDFEKIKENNYKEYYYELFTNTLSKYPNHSFDLWKEGINNKIFQPQLHGREHLNVERWMKALKNNSKEVHFAFENNFFGISSTISNENNPSLMAALDYDNEEGKAIAIKSIKEASSLFESIFGFKSKTFIAPNHFWDENIEQVLYDEDINFLQGSFTQKTPEGKRRFHYLGETNRLNQIYFTRNVNFEPSSNNKKDWVSSSLVEIEKSFKYKKPAIICSHRVNFIGGIFEENRSNNLEMLDLVLKQTIKRWPEVEFMSSAELSELIK